MDPFKTLSDEAFLNTLSGDVKKLEDFNKGIEAQYGQVVERSLTLDDAEIGGVEEDASEQAVTEGELDTQLNEAVLGLATDES